MTFGDPLLLVGDGEACEELGAPIGSWWNVEDAAEDVGNLESKKTESHVGETLTFFWHLGHVWSKVGVVHVQRLVDQVSVIV